VTSAKQLTRTAETLIAGAAAPAMGFLIGLTMTSGRMDLSLVVVLAVAGTLTLLRPSVALLAALFGALILVGLVQLYAPALQRIQWAIAAATAVLGAIGMLEYLFSPRRNRPLPPTTGLVMIFLALIVASAIINTLSVSQLAYGLKGYGQVIGLIFAITLLRGTEKTTAQLPRLLVAFALLQLPFVLHQWFFIVPQRVGVGSGIVAEDVVAGTMGATLMGGGSNAVLSLLLVTAIAIISSGYRVGAIRARNAAAMVAVCALPVFLNANRVAIVYLFVVFIVVFAREIYANPKRFVIGALAVVVLVSGAIWANANLSSRIDEAPGGWRDMILTTIERNVESGYGYGEKDLNRVGSIVFWWQEHIRRPTVSSVLFGHGPGAAREASDSALPVQTLAQTKYPGVGIGLTAVSSLLWELGLVGLGLVIAILWSSYRSASFLIRSLDERDYKSWVALGLKASIIIFAISLVHKNTLVFHLTYQSLLFTVIGVLSSWHYAVLKDQADEQVVRSLPSADEKLSLQA